MVGQAGWRFGRDREESFRVVPSKRYAGFPTSLAAAFLDPKRDVQRFHLKTTGSVEFNPVPELALATSHPEMPDTSDDAV
jgi:hypothetical protein